MNIPQILNESITVLKGIVDNADDLAILNVLNSKMANLVSIKNCMFKQFSNTQPKAISYYCMAFIPSGFNKDFTVNCINDYLIPFVKKDLVDRVEEYKQKYEYEQGLTRVGKKAEKEIQEELDKIRYVNLEIANANYTGIYKEAEQIDKMGFGSLYVRMGELGDFLELAQMGDKSKKEFYSKLKDIFDGTFYPSIIAGDSKRKTLENIPIQIYLYTDYENLYNPKLKEYYLGSLKTGMARRSFIFIPDNDDKIKLKYPSRPEEKEQAVFKAIELQKRFKNIYDIIQEKTVYSFSEEAKELLYQYQCKCIDYFMESKDDIIIKIERKESFWKITKLAVVYSIIDNPTSIIVQSKYVQMAIDFYKLISPSLKKVIEKRKKSEIEKYAEYIADHKDDIITRTDLRNLNYVHNAKFKKFFDEHLDEIKEELEVNYNLLLYPYEGGNKSLKAYQVVKKG